MAADLYRVARILRSHGLAGEWKIQLMGTRSEQLNVGKWVAEDRFGQQRAEVHPESIRWTGSTAIVRCREMEDRTAADRFTGGYLSVRAEDLLVLSEGEYYVEDLIGLAVLDEEQHRVGTLSDVLKNAPHDLYEVEHDGRRSLIPAVDEIVRSIDLVQRTMTIRPIPGLLE